MANIVWIFGLAMILATFSFDDFIAHRKGIKLRLLLKEASFRRPFVLGTILGVAGAGLSVKSLWLTLILILASFGISALSIKLLKIS